MRLSNVTERATMEKNEKDKKSMVDRNFTFLHVSYVRNFFHDKGFWVDPKIYFLLNKEVQRLMEKAIERTKLNKYIKKTIRPEAI